jgi:hypothetical protein
MASFHSSEKCFRRYERVIADVVRRFPQEVRFRSERAPTTDAARLKDAIASYRKQNWATECIDRKLFLENVYGHITVEARQEFVLVGPRVPKEVEVVEVSGVTAMAGSISRPTKAQIDLAIAVIEQGIVQIPIQLENVEAELMKYAESEVGHCFNVATKIKGSTLILI